MDGQNKSVNLVKAIEELENFFYCEKEGELYKFLLSIVEKPVIENVLRKTEGNQLKAANALGINRNTLHAKIKKLGINIRNFRIFK